MVVAVNQQQQIASVWTLPGMMPLCDVYMLLLLWPRKTT